MGLVDKIAHASSRMMLILAVGCYSLILMAQRMLKQGFGIEINFLQKIDMDSKDKQSEFFTIVSFFMAMFMILRIVCNQIVRKQKKGVQNEKEQSQKQEETEKKEQ